MIKFLLLTLIFSVIGLSLFSQDSPISHELMDYYTRQTQEVQTKSSHSGTNRYWVTPFIRRVANHWEELSPEAKSMFASFFTAPSLTGEEQLYERDHMIYHYTVSTGNSDQDVDSTDANGNNVPDYVELMAYQFDKSLSKYHEELKLVYPVYTDINNSGLRYHVYISNQIAGDGIYGYVNAFDWSFGFGDNLNTSNVVEYDAIQSYMVMRSNYIGFGDAVEALSVTAAHEYMHAIIFGYDYDVDDWLHEGIAVWGEKYVYPEYNDYLQYISGVYETPDVPLNYSDFESSDFQGHWYSVFLFIEYLTQQTEVYIIPKFLEAMVSDEQSNMMSYHVIEELLLESYSEAFSSFNDLFQSYAVSSIITSENANVFGKYVIADADLYQSYFDYYASYGVEIRHWESDFEFDGEEITFASDINGNNRLMRLGFDPFRLSATEDFEISFLCDDPEVNMALVKYNDTESDIVFASNQETIRVSDDEKWDNYYIVVIRTDPDVFDLSSVPYYLKIEEVDVVNNRVQDENFKIYPNPSDAYLYLGDGKTLYDIQVIQLSGQVLIAQDQVRMIDVHTLPIGCYMLKIISENGVPIVEPFVVNR